MAKKNDEEMVAIYSLSIEELQRRYDEIGQHYSNTKNKILTFLAGSLGFLGFLYGDGNLFFPTQFYGRVLYCIGLIIYFIAIGLLIKAVQPILWSMPTDYKEHKNIRYSSLTKFQEYIIKEYIEATSSNQVANERKIRNLSQALALLIVGAVILIVIRTFIKYIV